MYSRLLAAIMVYSAAILVVGCASGPKPSSAADPVLEEARSQDTPDAKEYERMDAQYRTRNYNNVLARSKAFIKAYPQSNFLDHVYNLRGLSYIGMKQFQFAVFQIKKALELTKNDGLRNMASYNLAYVYFELGQIDQAAQSLDGIKVSDLDHNDRYKLAVLRAKIGRQKQDYAGAAEEIFNALKYMPEPRSAQTAEPLLGFLDEVLEPLASAAHIASLERMLSEHEDSPAADRLYYKIGAYTFSSGDKEKAKKYFEKLIATYPASRYYAQAKNFIRKMNFQGVVDPKRVGVLLTLSGKFGKFGYKALQGIQLAFKIFKSPEDPNPPSLVVMDDQGDPDRAAAAMEDLFYKHHVTAVIGPLISKLADPVAKKAQELGVPLITLTQKEAAGGDFIFNAALTPAMQVRELVRYATEKAGAKHFAMAAPNSKFGEEYVKAFWDEVERNNGDIRGFETYPNDETDFRNYIDKLVGLAQTDARAHEVEELKLLKAATPVKTRSKKFDRMFELKPIVDFEAVFIPDEPKTLGQILPTFAYRDVDKVLFLGINTWNSQELIARAGQFAEGAVFVDGFYAGSQQPATKQFIEEYRQTFNSEPSLVEAMAYDAGHMVASILRSDAAHSRSDMKDRILSLHDFPGVSGKISYQAGRLTKRLVLLTVKSGKIEEIAFQ